MNIENSSTRPPFLYTSAKEALTIYDGIYAVTKDTFNDPYEAANEFLHTAKDEEGNLLYTEFINTLANIHPSYARNAIGFFGYILPDVLEELRDRETDAQYIPKVDEFGFPEENSLGFLKELEFCYPYTHSEMYDISHSSRNIRQLAIILCLTRNYLRRLRLPETPGIYMGIDTDIDEFNKELALLKDDYERLTPFTFENVSALHLIGVALEFGIYDPFYQDYIDED